LPSASLRADRVDPEPPRGLSAEPLPGGRIRNDPAARTEGTLGGHGNERRKRYGTGAPTCYMVDLDSRRQNYAIRKERITLISLSHAWDPRDLSESRQREGHGRQRRALASAWTLYLIPLDRRMDRLCKGNRLVHYVDDIVLLARTRWELRRAISALHQEIAAFGLQLHCIKCFIGHRTQGFDFLGDQIRAGARLRPSAEGLRRMRVHARRLYEREGDWQRLRQYVLCW
jgi:hypothetical protein